MNSGRPLIDPTAGGSLAAVFPQAGSRLRGLIQQASRVVSLLALAGASYFIFSNFVLQTVRVVGKSMTPTLRDSHTYLLNRWVYHVRSPHKSDIIVLRDPDDHGFSVKRIVAAEGDTIYLRDGKVHVNGKILDEPYLMPGTPTYPYYLYKEQKFTVGKGEFFVLGDNRQNSTDSRCYGPVPRQAVLGMLIR